MTRPRKAVKRTRNLILRMSDEDMNAAAALAKQAQLSVSACMRKLIHDGVVVQPPPASAPGSAANALFVYAGQLRKIGVNINQQMAVMHVQGEPPPELRRLWEKLETLLDRIISGEAPEGV